MNLHVALYIYEFLDLGLNFFVSVYETLHFKFGPKLSARLQL